MMPTRRSPRITSRAPARRSSIRAMASYTVASGLTACTAVPLNASMSAAVPRSGGISTVPITMVIPPLFLGGRRQRSAPEQPQHYTDVIGQAEEAADEGEHRRRDVARGDHRLEHEQL